MKTIRVFLGADMRSSHNGLYKMIKSEGIDVSKMKIGEAILFINRAKDRLKSLSSNGVLSYVNTEPLKRKIDLDVIEEIPRAMGIDGSMDYPKAMRLMLQKKLESKKFKKMERI
jgi:hypothetical protein